MFKFLKELKKRFYDLTENTFIWVITLLLFEFLVGYPFTKYVYSTVTSVIETIYENMAYEAIQEINDASFDELSNKEDDFKEVKIYHGMEYPWDKEVVILDKQTKERIILFIENDNGKAKVVDVSINGKQVIFK